MLPVYNTGGIMSNPQFVLVNLFKCYFVMRFMPFHEIKSLDLLLLNSLTQSLFFHAEQELQYKIFLANICQTSKQTDR